MALEPLPTDLRPAAPLDALAGARDPHARVRALVGTERGTIGVIAVYALGAGLLALAVPLAVQSLVNFIAFEALLQPVVVLSFMLLLALGLMGACQAMQTWLAELVQQRLFVRAFADLAYRLPRVRREAFDAAHGPELVNRFFSVFTIQKSASLLLMDGLAVALQTVIGLLLVAFYHPMLLAFDLVLVGVLAFILVVIGRRAAETSIRESKYKFEAAAWLEELVRHPGSFKSAAGHLFAIERADAMAMAYLEARRAHFRILFRKLVALLTLQAVSSALLLGVGGYLVVQRQLTLGQLVAAELVVATVVAGFVKMAKHLEAYYDMLAAADKLGILLDLPLERHGGGAASGEGPACVALRSVVARLGEGPPLLDRLSLELPAGARVGLAAGHEAGTGLLIEVLGGLREPAAGGVEVDGLDLRDLDLAALRRQVAVVRLCDVFAGSVLENVQLGRPEVGLAEARRALEAVGLWEPVQAMPDGLSTVLGPGGYPLSPREAGRLALARAVAGAPRLLLVDEALDGLDAAQGERVLDAVFDPRAPWTLVVTSHDPRVLSRCERRLALRDGRLAPVEQLRGRRP